MSIVVVCDCGKNLRINDSLAGKRIRCPICREILAVPAIEDNEMELDEAEQQPRARAKETDKPKPKRSTSNWLVLGLGCTLFILLGGVVTVAFIINSHPEGEPFGQVNPPLDKKNQEDGRDQQHGKKKQPETNKKGSSSLLTDELLAKAFLADEEATLKKYGGKTLEMVGTVENIDAKELALMLQGHGDLKNPKGFVYCAFSLKDMDQVTDLAKGQAVKIQGKLNKDLPILRLEDCRLLEAKPPAVFDTLTDEQLMKEYYAKKQAATEKYLGKVLEISGVVDRVNLENAGTLSVWLQGYASPSSKIGPWVLCDLLPKYEIQAINLSKGQFVKIRGKCVASKEVPPQLLQGHLVEMGKDPAIVLSAAQLLKEFSADKDGIAKKYHDKAMLLEGVVVDVKENVGSYEIVLAGADDSAAKSLHIKVGGRVPKKLLPIMKGQTIQVRGVAGIHAPQGALFLNEAIVVQRKS